MERRIFGAGSRLGRELTAAWSADAGCVFYPLCLLSVPASLLSLRPASVCVRVSLALLRHAGKARWGHKKSTKCLACVYVPLFCNLFFAPFFPMRRRRLPSWAASLGNVAAWLADQLRVSADGTSGQSADSLSPGGAWAGPAASRAAAQRVRGLMERAVSAPATAQCPAAWRLYLAFELSVRIPLLGSAICPLSPVPSRVVVLDGRGQGHDATALFAVCHCAACFHTLGTGCYGCSSRCRLSISSPQPPQRKALTGCCVLCRIAVMTCPPELVAMRAHEAAKSDCTFPSPFLSCPAKKTLLSLPGWAKPRRRRPPRFLPVDCRCTLVQSPLVGRPPGPIREPLPKGARRAPGGG